MRRMEVQVLEVPVKSISDKKNYRVIRLENGLTALLISDEAYPLDKLDEEEKDVAEANDEEDEEVDDEEDGEEEEETDEEDEGEEDDDEEMDDDDGGGSKRKVMECTGLKMS